MKPIHTPFADTGGTESAASIWLHRLAKLVVGATFVLIFIGGLVTSTDSGLAVPDWPTTYGHFMFAFPLSQMVGGILYEHSHRLVATVVGLLTTILTIWLFVSEPRRWVRWFGLAALMTIILQGILGGITVLFLLPIAVSVSHAALAQTFFCLTVCLAMFTSPARAIWPPGSRPMAGLHASDQFSQRPPLQNLTVAITTLIYLQLLLGALMRHTKSGLAIPDFPLAFGKLVPKFASTPIVINFAHRLGALAVAVIAVWLVIRILRHYRFEKELLRTALLLAGALLAQLTFGALTVWTRKAILPTTAHVATGALLLGTSVVLALRAHRLGRKSEPISVDERIAEMGQTGEWNSL